MIKQSIINQLIKLRIINIWFVNKKIKIEVKQYFIDKTIIKSIKNKKIAGKVAKYS
jgi:hypothetical protein